MALPNGSNYNKVIYGGQVLIDLTADTVDPAHLLSGARAHDKSGAAIEGACTYDADTGDATAAAAELLLSKTAYVNGNKITGAMPNNGSVTGTISAKAGKYTIPQGYHDGAGKVGIAAAEQDKIVAANIRQGITILGVEGSMTGTEDVVAGSPTVTPSTAQQVITPSTGEGENYLAQVTVAAIPFVETENTAGGYTATIA